MNPPTASIYDLPPEMICELFKHLGPKDLIVCSMVNKRWHSIYADFKVHRLIVIFQKFCPISKWYDSNRRTEDPELCHSEIFERLADRPLLSRLKHLALFPGGPQYDFDLNQLNRFSQLVHLEIDLHCYAPGYCQENVKLSLPRLKVFAGHGHNHWCPMTIDFPELNVLRYSGEDGNLLDLKHPETIRKLQTNMFGPELSVFRNVECLVTWEFEMICRTTLLSLPKLKELHHHEPVGDLFQTQNEVGTLDQMKRTLKEFVDDVKALRGSDFQFRFAGFQLTRTKVDEIDFGLQVDEGLEYVFDEYIYLKNCHLIDPNGTLDFIRGLNYDRLMSYVNGEIPACFLQKFTLESNQFIPKV